MRRLVLITLPLLAGGAALLSAASPPALHAASLEDAYAELVTAYDQAYDQFRESLRAAKDLKERRALRDQHPARAFWPRFEALAEAGEGRGYLWMIEHAGDRGLKVSETEAAKVELFDALVRDHAAADWFEAGLDALWTERDAVGDPFYVLSLKDVLKRNESRDVKAMATYLLWDQQRDVGAPEAEVQALFERLTGEFGDTKWGIRAKSELVREADVQVGKVAPDFIGTTIDGHEFKLSDYKGKVVLIDFYGFW